MGSSLQSGFRADASQFLEAIDWSGRRAASMLRQRCMAIVWPRLAHRHRGFLRVEKLRLAKHKRERNPGYRFRCARTERRKPVHQERAHLRTVPRECSEADRAHDRCGAVPFSGQEYRVLGTGSAGYRFIKCSSCWRTQHRGVEQQKESVRCPQNRHQRPPASVRFSSACPLPEKLSGSLAADTVLAEE